MDSGGVDSGGVDSGGGHSPYLVVYSCNTHTHTHTHTRHTHAHTQSWSEKSYLVVYFYNTSAEFDADGMRLILQDVAI